MYQSGSPIQLPNDCLAMKTAVSDTVGLRTDSCHYFINKWTIWPCGKTDAPSGPSMGISLLHMDFLSTNGGALAKHCSCLENKTKNFAD